jgi:hypothetical protein
MSDEEYEYDYGSDDGDYDYGSDGGGDGGDTVADELIEIENAFYGKQQRKIFCRYFFSPMIHDTVLKQRGTT